VINTPPAAPTPDAACRHILAEVPEVRVRPGERIVFHLGFEPSALRLTIARGLWTPPLEGPGRTVSLPATAEPAWTSTGPGGIVTLVPETSAGTVRYRARMAITTDQVAPRLTGVRAERRGRGLAIRFRLSERATVTGCVERIGRRGVAAPRSGRLLPERGFQAGMASATVRALPRGRYRLSLVAQDPGGNRAIRSLTFDRPPR
jgi:hypothetical protein